MEKFYPTYEQAEVAAQTEIKAQLNESFGRFQALADKCEVMGIVGLQPTYCVSNVTRDKKLATMRQYPLKNLFIPGDRYELSQINWRLHHRDNRGQISGFKSLVEAIEFIEKADG